MSFREKANRALGAMVRRSQSSFEAVRRYRLRLSTAYAYQECFSTPAGQVVLADLARTSGIGGDPFELGYGDRDAIMRKLGQQLTVRRIRKMLKMSEDELIEMADKAEETEHGELENEAEPLFAS